MSTVRSGSEHSRPVDRDEAARLLAAAESTRPVATSRDVRTWSLLCVCLGVLMAVFTTLCSISNWFIALYALLAVGSVLWLRRTATATARGVSRLYDYGIAGSSALLLVYVAVVAVVGGGVEAAPLWTSVVGGLCIALPMFVAAARIARTAGR